MATRGAKLADFGTFSLMQPRKLTLWEFTHRIIEVVTVLAIVVGAGAVYFTAEQFQEMNAQTKIQSQTLQDQSQTLHDTEAVASATFVNELGDQLSSSDYSPITNAIEGPNYTVHPSNYPILQSRGGQFTPDDVTSYIGTMDRAGDLYLDHLIDIQVVYDEMSYDVEKAWCNTDVQSVIQHYRDTSGLPSGRDAWFMGFETLAKQFMQKDGYTCKDLDTQ